MIGSQDIENAIQGVLNTSWLTACAPPLRKDYASHLPFALCTQTGGSNQDIVLDTFAVSVDVYASSWASAKTNANKAAALLKTYEGTKVSNIPWYSVDIEPMAYNNPDPLNPETPRCTFGVRIKTRTTTL